MQSGLRREKNQKLESHQDPGQLLSQSTFVSLSMVPQAFSCASLCRSLFSLLADHFSSFFVNMEEDGHPKTLQFVCPSRGQQRLVTTSNSLEEDFDYSAWGSMHPFPISFCWADRIHVAQTGSQGSVSRSTGLRESVHQFPCIFSSIRGSHTLTPTAKPPESHR